jgi:cephalosporin hydroxylase
MIDDNKPSKFVTCDIEYNKNIDIAKKMADKEGLDFEYIIGDDLEIDLPETDLMFIDTQHTYTQLKKELFQLHHLSKKYIIMHDTVSFERHGLAESGCEFFETKGLKDAIEEFLESHGDEWEIHEHHTYCNGLTIMKRK